MLPREGLKEVFENDSCVRDTLGDRVPSGESDAVSVVSDVSVP